jgi:IclR family KDG regulon transcriptional repressor
MSLYKGFAIIECLSRNGEMGIQQLSQELGMNKSTVYRFLSSLHSMGYVKQDPLNKQYSLTYKFLQLGREKNGHESLVSQVHPFMEKLLAATGESVHLAVLQDTKVVYIDQVESQSTIRVNVEIGKTFPAYSVGVGKAMLAFLPEKEVTELFRHEPFVKYTEKTIDSLKKLQDELQTVRERGYALDNEECMEGLACVAVPLFSLGSPVAAISVTFPRFRYAENSEGENKIIEKTMYYSDILNNLHS